MNNTHRVFVYGTLKKGHYNNTLLEEAEFVGAAKTVGNDYTMYHLGAFPGVKEGGCDSITGEVYNVNDEQLARLHQLEGHPTFYKAVNKQVRLFNNSISGYMEALMYIYQGNANNIKAGGTW